MQTRSVETKSDLAEGVHDIADTYLLPQGYCCMWVQTPSPRAPQHQILSCGDLASRLIHGMIKILAGRLKLPACDTSETQTRRTTNGEAHGVHKKYRSVRSRAEHANAEAPRLL